VLRATLQAQHAVPAHAWPEMTALLSAASGRVCLDAVYPCVCLRGPEVGSRPDLGYR